MIAISDTMKKAAAQICVALSVAVAVSACAIKPAAPPDPKLRPFGKDVIELPIVRAGQFYVQARVAGWNVVLDMETNGDSCTHSFSYGTTNGFLQMGFFDILKRKRELFHFSRIIIPAGESRPGEAINKQWVYDASTRDVRIGDEWRLAAEGAGRLRMMEMLRQFLDTACQSVQRGDAPKAYEMWLTNPGEAFLQTLPRMIMLDEPVHPASDDFDLRPWNFNQ